MHRGDKPIEAPWLNGWPDIHDERVRAAFVRVPRAAFVGDDWRSWASFDTALPIAEGQTISQPYVVAMMSQALMLEPGQRVLEIGTGSGYQTAILCELTSNDNETRGQYVWSVERSRNLAQKAADLLESLGYRPNIFIGDGAAGMPDMAPFDAIVVTAAAPALPRPLWEQLKEGGRLVIPIGATSAGQILWQVTKHNEQMVRRSLGGVRFVPFISTLLFDPRERIEFSESPIGD